MQSMNDRTRLLLGKAAMERLSKAHVLIAGVGAVGSMAAEALVRSGVCHLTLVDFDVVSISNFNRQIFATTASLNQPKVKVAEERLRLINPSVCIRKKELKISAQTIELLFDEPFDFAIDAIDSLNAKTILIEAFMQKKIPFVSAMGAALKTDMTRVRLSAMKKTIECPLAAFVRKRLRRRGVDLSFPVVWSDECVSDKKHLAPIEETGFAERRAMGSVMTITGVFGLMCAHEALLFLTHNEKSFYDGRF